MINDISNLETRTPPDRQELIKAAQQQPNGWVYDIDYEYREDQRVPPEAIRGAWESDGTGQLTGRYAPNARYRAICHRKPDLKPYMHAGARTNRDQWIVDIDPRGEELFPNIPPNMIRGWWYVDKEGIISDNFRPSSQWVDDPAHHGDSTA